MSDLRKAAEMALGDLEDLHKHHAVTCASSMAALRAALRRETLNEVHQGMHQEAHTAAAVAAEREACAKVCEPQDKWDDPLTAWTIVQAIRARGEP